jgi:hypothetical protein
MFKASRFEAVEISVPSGSTLTRFYFQDLPNLTGRAGFPVQIQSIVFYNRDIITKSALTGSNLVTTADMQRSFLTIYQGDLQVLYNIPVVTLNAMQTGTSSAPFTTNLPLLNGLENVSWTKSFVSLPSALTTTDVVYCIGVYYCVNY